MTPEEIRIRDRWAGARPSLDVLTLLRLLDEERKKSARLVACLRARLRCQRAECRDEALRAALELQDDVADARGRELARLVLDRVENASR